MWWLWVACAFGAPHDGVAYGGGAAVEWSPVEPGFQSPASMAGGIAGGGELLVVFPPFRIGPIVTVAATFPREAVSTSVRGVGVVAFGGQWGGKGTYSAFHLGVGGHAYSAFAKGETNVYVAYGPALRIDYSVGFPLSRRAVLEVGPVASLHLANGSFQGAGWNGSYAGNLGLDLTVLVDHKNTARGNKKKGGKKGKGKGGGGTKKGGRSPHKG